MVITVPGTFIIERNEKQVGLFELLQHLLAPGLTGHSIAERPVQAIEDGGLQQERTDMLRLLAQHFFRLIIHDVAMASSEGGDEAGKIFSPLHGESCQLQSSNPSLSTILQCSNIVRRQVEAHDAIEKGRCLIKGKTQVVRTQFDQLTPHPQTRERQRWVDAAGNYQV